jgi:HicA toxin of bacterial toxin-antitoxin,
MATLASYHRQTLVAIFARPTSGTIKWREIENLFEALGASIQKRKGSRICVSLNGKDAIFHRPHPSPDTDKGAVNAVRKFLTECGVEP